MFRGKESLNRIELSQLVQDLLNFGVLGSLQLWGGGSWVGSIWGHGECPPTHTCTHAHLYMYRNCKWPLTWRHPCLACLACMCMCACMRVHACMHKTPPTYPYPLWLPSTHLPPPHGDGPPTHMHTHACTCTHAHLYMYRNCKWPPTWRHPCLACLACLTCMCMCACMCVHVCMHKTPPTYPYPLWLPSTHLPPPQGGELPESLKIW